MKPLLALAAALSLLPIEARTQATSGKPNFTGVWKLVEEVMADARGGPPAFVHKIEQRADFFEITVFDGDSVRIPRESFTIGAQAVKVPSSCCGDGEIRYWWEGRALHSTFTWKTNVNHDVRTLADDGRTMTVIRKIKEGNSPEREILWVFEKQ